ncbi:MAG: helix-turn-helix domain-containing protein [Candidatus Omnitrophota bacterium]|jgi:two-component system nitrogen regulation response regulator GlnG
MGYVEPLKRQGLFHSLIADTEKPLIEKTLKETFGNQLKAAKVLGINRNTLRNKIRKLGIEVGRWKS